MALHTGDMVVEGTSASVGQGVKPPIWLSLGKSITLLGRQQPMAVPDGARGGICWQNLAALQGRFLPAVTRLPMRRIV